jgi:hypothetical protein
MEPMHCQRVDIARLVTASQVRVQRSIVDLMIWNWEQKEKGVFF